MTASIPLAEVLSRHERARTAWQAAMTAGGFLQHERPATLAVQTKSSATDAVSQMDRGAEQRIVEAVLTSWPDDAILGEEGGERAGTSGIRWVIDPLDGTVNYLARIPNWAVSIAVEAEGVARCGVVVAPALDEAYLAIRGQGAWTIHDATAVPIRAGGEQDLGLALIATGFSYDAGRRSVQGLQAAALLPKVRDLRRLGAAALDLCWTACGRLDGFYEAGLSPWDIAAGALIAQEAGCTVGPLEAPGRGDVADRVATFVAAAPGIDLALRGALLAAAS